MGRPARRRGGLHRAENHRHRRHRRAGGGRRRVDAAARRRGRGRKAAERTAAHPGLRRAEGRLPAAHARLRRPPPHRTRTRRPAGSWRTVRVRIVVDTITERFVDSVGRCSHRRLRAGQPGRADAGDGARLARFARVVGRRRLAAGRPVPDHPLRQPRRWQIVCTQAGFGIHNRQARRRPRRGHRAP